MVSVKHRARVLGVVVLVTILVAVFWTKPPGYEDIVVPQPNWLGSTWYGPLLLMAIPVCVAWLSWGARNLFIKVIGLVFSVLLTGAAAFLIVLGREGARGWF
jgi:hypothetical protein